MTIVCPRCDSENIVKKGFSKNTDPIKQVHLCKDCNRRFTVGKHHYHDRYKVKALNMYTSGMTLDEIGKQFGKRYRKRISRTTLHRWIKTHSHLSPMMKNRKTFRKSSPIVTREMVHRGLIYRYSYHRLKIEYLKRPYPELAEYLTGIEDRPEYQEGERCSQLSVITDVEQKPRDSFACSMARFAVNEAEENRDRHEAVENFMLINDTATIAKEVPVYFWEKRRGSITGHIDLLQHRYGKIHILDYKPEAKKGDASGQLLLYARGLSFRTGVPLENMECGWFDERDHISFSPAETRWRFL